MRQNLAILVENQSGVLARVANLFARRGFNIESLAVGTTNNPEISRITVSIFADENQTMQIVKQLHKLPVVLKVKRLEKDAHFSRELVFCKVTCDAVTRTSILQIVDIFRGHIIDVSPSTATIEISGSSDKILALIELLAPYGILEMVRTGLIAIERGERVLSLDS
jgi:acetolactate synthase-1/3 small subunit